MDVNAKLNGKQILIALVVIMGFGYFFEPVQIYILRHPWVGLVLLAAIISGWWFYRKSSRQSAKA